MFIKFLMFFTGPILYGESLQLPVPIRCRSIALCDHNRCSNPLLLLFASCRGRASSFGRKRLGVDSSRYESDWHGRAMS